MSYLTLSEIKDHLNLNSGTADDTKLQTYIDSAEGTFTELTGRTLDTNATTGFPAGVPATVKHGLLLLTGHNYRVREAFGDQDVAAMPFGFVSVCRRHSLKYVSPGSV